MVFLNYPMITLNTTFYIHPSLETEFVSWVREFYIPSATESGLCNPSMSIILANVGEDVIGFALQFDAQELSVAEKWHDGKGGCVRADFISRHGQKALFFSTYLEKLPIE